MTIPYVSESTVARGTHRNVIGGEVAIPASGSTSVTLLMSKVPRLTVLPVSYVLKRAVVHLDSRLGSAVTSAYCAKLPPHRPSILFAPPLVNHDCDKGNDGAMLRLCCTYIITNQRESLWVGHDRYDCPPSLRDIEPAACAPDWILACPNTRPRRP
jgi:hypothetical protein